MRSEDLGEPARYSNNMLILGVLKQLTHIIEKLKIDKDKDFISNNEPYSQVMDSLLLKVLKAEEKGLWEDED